MIAPILMRIVGILAGWLLLTGSSSESMLRPFGPQAARISNLWWLFFWILAIVYVVTMLLTMYAVGRAAGRRRESNSPELPMLTGLVVPDHERDRERRLKRSVIFATGLTTVILLVLLVSSFATGSAIGDFPKNNPLIVQVTGHQWWWEFRYVDTVASNRLTVANELHIPVGRPVILHLSSNDVIHSFWLPNMHGKRDLIPGYRTDLWFQADHAGVYRGTCAEFCGYQHAKMGFLVIAEPPDKYDTWFENAKKPALEPVDSMAKRGKEVFMSMPCSNCHSIMGTPAGGHVGPDLTHFGSQRTLAAATFPNNIGHVTGWVTDPQSLKPGVYMPQNVLSPHDLRAVVQYLESLK